MKAYMFDLDGTLLYTLEDIGQACNTVLQKHGYPVHDLPSYRQRVGNGFHALVCAALPAPVLHSISPGQLDALVTEARQCYSRNMMQLTRPYDGIPEVLETLAARGHALAVLSNKPHELTVSIIAHYFPQLPFACVRGAQPDGPLKPDAAGAAAILASLGRAAQDCYYVGDSDVDVLTARNAGMVSVGVAWGFRGADEVRAAGACHVVQTPAELAQLPA